MKEVRIKLPMPHAGQQQVIDGAQRWNVLECGRRWGKTTCGLILAAHTVVKPQPVGWFAPTYKYLADPWRALERMLAPLVRKISKMEQRIELLTGGVIDFWSLDNPDAGRGRKYKRIILDEASIIRDLQPAWQETLRPTLTDLRGDAWFLGTPKGRNFFHQLFAKGEANEPQWKSWRLPTTSNPHMDPAEIEAARRELPEHVFNQEYLGIPADDGGNPFGMESIRRIARLDNLSPGPSVAFGVDLAKSSDWSVIVGLNALGQVCAFDRWQSDWGQTRERIKRIVGHTRTLIDSTGVGDPIVEELQRSAPGFIIGFQFTAKSKQQLMEGLASAIQTGEIAIPAESVLQRELEAFEYEFTRIGVRYSAPSGLHDDAVCALALAVQCFREKPMVELEIRVLGGGQADDENDPWG